MNLSDRHKTLLQKIVEVVDRGCLSEFMFMPGGLGNVLSYECHPNVSVDADESDLQELAAHWLITLERNHLNILHGKPTELD